MGVVMMIQRNIGALSLLTVIEVLAWFDTQMLEAWKACDSSRMSEDWNVSFEQQR